MDEALKGLLLISDRFSRNAYRKADPQLTSYFYKTVSDCVLLEPNIALNLADRLFSNPSEAPSSPYLRGLIIGLINLGASKSDQLKVLRKHPDAATVIIGIEPKIGFYFLKSEEFTNLDRSTAEELASWLSNISNPDTLSNIRKVLLPEVSDGRYKSIAEELLRQVHEEDIDWILETLSISTKGFMDSEIERIINEKVSKQYPYETREWAVRTSNWSNNAARIISATYSEGLSGIEDIIQANQFDRSIKAQILAAFIHGISRNHSLPQWFQDLAKNNVNLLPTLIPINTKITVDVENVIKQVLDEIWQLPLVHEFDVSEIDAIISSNLYSFSSSLISTTMRSAVSDFIMGNVSWETYQTWESTGWGEKWLSYESARDIQLIFSRKCFTSQDAWLNGWRWLANVSENFYVHNATLLPKLIESQLASAKGNWGPEITKLLIHVLSRIHMQSKPYIEVQACSEVLNFAFRNYRYPVSKVVVEAFFPVYQAVITSEELPQETYKLINYYDWDKGKELRKKLIGVFLDAKWPLGDLALAAREKPLLRKIYSRIHRSWKGDDYIQSMKNDLRNNRDDPSARIILGELNSIINEQNFHESWD